MQPFKKRVSKEVYSLIYAANKDDVFPDLDHSFPLRFYAMDPKAPDTILNLIKSHFPKYSKNIVAYVLGGSEIASLIYNFLKDNPDLDIQHIYFKIPKIMKI